MAKRKTYNLTQIAGRQARAVRMAREIRGDESRAVELEAMTPEEYAQGRGLLIQNPSTQRSNTTMAKKMIVTVDADELEELRTGLAEAETALSDIWEEHAQMDNSNTKAALLTASTETVRIINEFDPDQFPIESDDATDDEDSVDDEE
jgi:hypothetical protein